MCIRDSINSDMRNVCEYVKENSLSLNGRKSDLIIFGSHFNIRRISDNFSCIVDDVEVVRSDKVKCVGFIFDSMLTWKEHINMIAKKCYFRIRILYTVRQYFSAKTLEIIGTAMVLSLCNYMSSVWGATSDKYLIVIEKILRALARCISFKRKYDRIACIIKDDL